MDLVRKLPQRYCKPQAWVYPRQGVSFTSKTWRNTFAAYLLSLPGSTFELIYFCIMISGFIFALGWVVFFNDTFISILAGGFFIKLMHNMYKYRTMFYAKQDSL